MKLFKKKSPAIETRARWNEVRSRYGFAWHLIDSHADASTPLCGYSGYDQTGVYNTDEDILASVPNQHEGWHYCSRCLTEFQRRVSVPTES